MNGSGFRVADRGEGWAQVITRCFDESIRAPFFYQRSNHDGEGDRGGARFGVGIGGEGGGVQSISDGR